MQDEQPQAVARKQGGTWVLRALLFAFALTSLVAGGAKLAEQRAHPPRFATKRNNNFEGWVAIDGHATRAALVRAWMEGEDPGAVRLLTSLREQSHSTSIAIPPLVALVSFPLGSVPYAFILLSGLAWLLQLGLVMRLAALVDTRGDPDTPLIAGVLFAGHCLSARTVLQLMLDPFVAVFATLAFLCTSRWLERRSRTSAVCTLLVLIVGSFTKLSFLPVLGLPVFLALLGRRRGALRPALALGGLAALVLAAYLALVVGAGSSVADVKQFSTSWSLTPQRLRQFGVEMLLLVQAFPLLLLVRRGSRRPGAPGVAVAMALVLAPLLAFGLPAVPRLYLPVFGFGIALCAGRFAEAFRGRTRVGLLLAYGTLNLLVAVLGLVLPSS